MAGMWLRQLTVGCGLLLGFGLLWLLAYVVTEATIGQGGGSLVDAYWRGRLPWMGVAEALIVVGATATAVAGTLAAMVGGGWIRRIAVVPPLSVIGLWWFLAIAMSMRRAVPCNDCPPPAPDPWAFAYSLPETTLLYLLVPAVLIAFVTLAGKPLGNREISAPP